MTNKEALHVVAKTSINPDEIANAQNKVKEETTMENSKKITFTVGHFTYESNEKGNRFYQITNGKKIRISEAVFNDALDQYNKANAWEAEADAEKKAREDKVEADAKQAEEAVAKKTKKKAKKNVAFRFTEMDGTETTLTEKQVDFIKHLPDTCFYENGVDSALWIDVLADEIGGQFENKPMTVGAMVSTLREKGIIQVGEDRINGRKCKFMTLSELGKMIALELGLN